MVETGYFKFARGLNRSHNTQRGMFDTINAKVVAYLRIQ